LHLLSELHSCLGSTEKVTWW